ncbi:hypothetical protein [Pseudonocardia parietis]|uniref:Uncharacterized protein n=1 Tax=Pseudonocardia parietis TaxID=570936 RepID=A0ABS4W211_9PSEU|nr:hypothetical protein [Pseudonocardia parietis]MBP2370243.1 hypothetical protein [Pseudonocardia parietis]
MGAGIQTPDGLCATCVRFAAHAITHLKGDVAELTMLIGRGGGAGGDKITQTREAPIPIRLGVEALRAEIDDQVQTWAELVAERLGIDWDTQTARRSRMGPRVTRAVDLLVNAVDTLVALPPQELLAWQDGEPVWDHELDCQDTAVMDGVDAALHLSHLHWRAYRIAGRTKLVHRLLPRCEHCGQRTLVREDGDEDARCESDRCRGRRIPGGRLNWLVMATTAVEQAARDGAEAVA